MNSLYGFTLFTQKCEGKKTDYLSEGIDLAKLMTSKAHPEHTTKAANEHVPFHAEELIVKFIYLLLAGHLSYTRKMIIKDIYFRGYNNLDYGSKAQQASSKDALKGRKAALRPTMQFTPEVHLFKIYFEKISILRDVIEETLKNWRHCEECPANVFSGWDRMIVKAIYFWWYNNMDCGSKAEQASSKADLKGPKTALKRPT
ncbi:hypothetical protein QYM36_011109 [Artemia franciscana]|uniref:Uncharacterized protein n=1 Tax=Artemia franciscana TaxID=6661 RepID=A0AA88HNS8_ARTSF|nr:hypothetical protein QYM36_011109 [Artemia franciscana]